MRVWRYWSGKFRSVLNVAGSIESREPPHSKQWKRATSRDQFDYPPLNDPSLDEMFWGRVPSTYTIDDALWKRQTDPKFFKEDEARTYLYSILFDWVRFAQLVIFLDPFRPGIEVSTPGLFSGLTLQLVLAINRTSLVECHGCPNFFAPVRRPRTDRHVYCPECQGENRAWTMGKRASRARAKKNATDCRPSGS